MAKSQLPDKKMSPWGYICIYIRKQREILKNRSVGQFSKTAITVHSIFFNNNNNIFISYIKYTNITPPANSKANRGRW